MTPRIRTLLPALLAAALLVLACNLARPPESGSPAVITVVATAASAAGAPSAASTPTASSAPPTAEAAPLPVLEWPLTIDEFLAPCPTAAQVAEVDAAVTLQFDSDPTAGRLVCTKAAGSADLTRLQKNAYNAVRAMKFLAFDAPLPWTDQSLYDWWTGGIDAVRFRADIDHPFCCGQPPTIHMMSNSALAYSDRWTVISRTVALFVHEARHRYMAHHCEWRDNSLADLGAMAAEYYFYEWVAYHANPDVLATVDGGVTDDYRQAARFFAYSMMRTSFCLEPTPSAYPPPLRPSVMAGKPFLTSRMARALETGIPVPEPVAPAEGSSQEKKGILFSWKPVDFPGGVTYSVEVDVFDGFLKDWRYWTAFSDEHGLTGTEYAPPIGFNPYDIRGRWRVWAVSPAAGEGPKSAWVEFDIRQ